MESVLNFIDANYIWLVIILVVILLAIIGFIADKRGFVNDLKKNKKKKNENINNKEVLEENDINEDLYAPLGDNTFENEELNQKEENEEVQEENDINEDLYAPLGDNTFENEELNIDEDFNDILKDVEETSNDVNIEIPYDEVTSELDNDEDIWKF